MRKIHDPAELKNYTEEQIYRDPNSDDIYLRDSGLPPDVQKGIEQEENINGRPMTSVEMSQMYPEYSSQFGGMGRASDLYNQQQSAGQNVQNMGNPSTGMNVLQEAIKTKNKVYDQPIGESEIFKKAGVGGMGVLNQSLAMRGREINEDYTRYQNELKFRAGLMQDQYTKTLNAYKMASDEYNNEMDRIGKIDSDLRNHKQALELLQKKADIDNQLNNNDILKIYKDFENAEEIISSMQGGDMRTDRHNNPTAFTTDIAKQAGLVLGTDYEQGDAFPDNPNMFTARLLGDSIGTTIKVIDNIGLKTGSGQNRWAYLDDIGMTQEKWDGASTEEKTKMIGQMYQAEGGGKSGFGDVTPIPKEEEEFTDEEKVFEKDLKAVRKKLTEDKDWGKAWETLKDMYPDIENETLDMLLNKAKYNPDPETEEEKGSWNLFKPSTW